MTRTSRPARLAGVTALALVLAGCTGQEPPSETTTAPPAAAAEGTAATALRLVAGAPDAAREAGSG